MSAFLGNDHIKRKYITGKECESVGDMKKYQGKTHNIVKKFIAKYDLVPMSFIILIIFGLTAIVTGTGIHFLFYTGIPYFLLCGFATMLQVISDHM